MRLLKCAAILSAFLSLFTTQALAQKKLKPVAPVGPVLVQPSDPDARRILSDPKLIVEGIAPPRRIAKRDICIAGAYIPTTSEPKFAAFMLRDTDGVLAGHFILYEEGLAFAPTGYGLDEENFSIVTSYDVLPPITSILVQYYVTRTPISFSGRLVEETPNPERIYMVRNIDASWPAERCSDEHQPGAAQ